MSKHSNINHQNKSIYFRNDSITNFQKTERHQITGVAKTTHWGSKTTLIKQILYMKMKCLGSHSFRAI